MTACKVARFNRSLPPEGYEVGPDKSLDSPGWYWIRGPLGGEGHRGDVAASEAEAIAAAWGYYEAHEDPPGVTCYGKVFYVSPYDGADTTTHAAGPDRAATRRAAWAWYWDAVELAGLLEAIWNGTAEIFDGTPEQEGAQLFALSMALADKLAGRERNWWPRALTWSTDQRAAVRRWLAEGGELPEVLRG